MFPPQERREDTSPYPPKPTNYLRGNIPIEAMTDNQRDDLMVREEAKKRNQIEIQEVLKQQIAQKEYEKQKRKAEQKMEDEKERERIEKEQALLKERYQREKLEAQKKAVSNGFRNV